MTNYDALLRNALYWGDTFDDIIDLYEKYLRQLGTVADINHANAINSFHRACNNKTLLKDLRSYFKELNNLFENENLMIYGRRKAFVSYEAKLRRYLEDGRDADDVRDVFAFRVVLLENNSRGSIIKLYKMTERIIDYFTKSLGLTVHDWGLEEHIKIRKEYAKFNISAHPELILPRKQFLTEENIPYVKDYIRFPKSNGYQSLHLLFKTPKGVFFEIQLRTLSQHAFNEAEDGSWKNYKKNKYPMYPRFNPKKIQIPGFIVSSNGIPFDTTGLIVPKEILRRS